MNVCMVAYSFYENDNRVRRYAETLARRGDTVDVIALNNNGDMPQHEEIGGVQLYRIQNRKKDERGNLTYLRKLLLFLVKSFMFISRMHISRTYHIVHVHSVPDFEVFAAIIPKLMGAKIILDIHDIVPEFYASKFKTSRCSNIFKMLLQVERISAKFADHVIVSNHIWEKTLVSRSVSSEKCTAILNYPDPAMFYARPRTRDDSKFIMLYPGTVNWHQGLDIAVKAFASVKDELQNAEFHIYGGNISNNSIIELIKELRLQDRVLFKHHVPLDEIAGIMADADLGIVPKRNDPFGGEAFSTKVLEFMSLGVPVVLSRTKVDNYYFNDAIVQFFKPEDEQDLARCIVKLAKDKTLRKEMAARASTFVASYRWDKRKEEYLNLVDDLVYPRSEPQTMNNLLQ